MVSAFSALRIQFVSLTFWASTRWLDFKTSQFWPLIYLESVSDWFMVHEMFHYAFDGIDYLTFIHPCDQWNPNQKVIIMYPIDFIIIMQIVILLSTTLLFTTLASIVPCRYLRRFHSYFLNCPYLSLHQQLLQLMECQSLQNLTQLLLHHPFDFAISIHLSSLLI